MLEEQGASTSEEGRDLAHTGGTSSYVALPIPVNPIPDLPAKSQEGKDAMTFRAHVAQEDCEVLAAAVEAPVSEEQVTELFLLNLKPKELIRINNH